MRSNVSGWFIGWTLLVATAIGSGAPTTRPALSANAWNSAYFQYQKPKDWPIEATTPTPAQLNFFIRPPRISPDAPDPVQTAGPVLPALVRQIRITHLSFRDVDGQIVPALLCEPPGIGPFPVVIAVHGLGSNKAQVCAQMGPALTKRGFAVLAPDMPLHGERPGNPHDILNADPEEGFQLHRRAIIDVRQCIDLAETRTDLDTSHGVILAGYSMGSWIDSVAGPADDRVREMVLMVGGAWDTSESALMIPEVAATDPRLAIAHFAGRPLLMLSAREDVIVTPPMSRRLFAAAREPKKQIWYESNHLLPSQAYEDAGRWIADTWETLTAESTTRP